MKSAMKDGQSSIADFSAKFSSFNQQIVEYMETPNSYSEMAGLVLQIILGTALLGCVLSAIGVGFAHF